jgi:hypothetical protein
MSDATQPAPNLATGFPTQKPGEFSINSLPFPGYWDIANLVGEVVWQENYAYGFDYATVRPIGRKLATFDIIGQLWSSSDFLIWRQTKRILFSNYILNLGITSAAYSCSHPKLLDFGVTSFVIRRFHGEENDGTGLWTIKFSCLEYRVPQPAPAKPEFAVPDAAPKKPTVIDQQDATIKALTGTIQELQGKL